MLVLAATIGRGAEEAKDAPPRVKNIVLMIGDGMGLAHLTLARFQRGRLWLEEAEEFGFSITSSLDKQVTDSSASATALASGFLIKNGHVGQHPDGTPTKTVLEYAEELGLWTGLVATSRVTHATPASMATHVSSRGMEFEIASQLAAKDIEVILGGGWDKFLPRREAEVRAPRSQRRDALALAAAWLLSPGLAAAAGAIAEDYGRLSGARTDRRDLLAEMRKSGYRTIYTPAELHALAKAPPRKTIGLFSREAMPKAAEGRSPSLTAMTHAALNLLAQSPKGFFLMVEGSQIDWGGHANDAPYAMAEAAEFDDAVGEVFRFLGERDLEDETLVVITADHETGGLTINVHDKLPLGFEPKWTTGYHTGIPVPVFSRGATARQFSGFQTHADIGRKLIETLLGRRLDWAYPAP